MFEKLGKSSFPQQIADSIRETIVKKKLAAGDRLPSERALAEEFGVSRSSIREGIRTLTALGVLETCPGTGTYVSANLASSILHPLSWAIFLSDSLGHDLVEARKVIEPAIAELAARRAEPEDLEALGDAYGKMVSSRGDPEALADADLAFHLTLAKVARNRLFHETIVGLQHLLRPLMAATLMSTSDQEAALGQHAAILEGVREKNPAKAREAMTRNVDDEWKLEKARAVAPGM
ncbi:MAG: FadR family transcriptional regulator [Anaerolineales bacterium]|nr:FadR family transcriptional regulator [Anaerolineales bacterium]